MAKRALAAGTPRRLLSLLLDSPHLAQVVQGLEPKVLHHLVRQCGLEQCGEIVALATAEQLTRIFDDDLWRSDSAGAEEEFDAGRFGLWLEVLAEVGPDVAARKVVEMDFDFVTAAFSRYLLVVDAETLWASHAPSELSFGDDEPVCDPATERALEASASYELSGYTVVAQRGESWDALLAVLTSLDRDHHAFFGRVMTRCCQISTEYIVDNGGLHEVLTRDQQVLDDIAGARAERREHQGYVAPTQAAAFLTLARRQASAEGRDPLTAGYFRELEHRAKAQGERPAVKAGPAPHAEAAERQVAGFVRSLEARVGSGPRRELRPPLRTVVTIGSRSSAPSCYSRRKTMTPPTRDAPKSSPTSRTSSSPAAPSSRADSARSRRPMPPWPPATSGSSTGVGARARRWPRTFWCARTS